jgi:deoxyribonuclease-4
MSIAGGMSRAVERALAVDATALQVFVKSSNQWAARPFATGEIEAFREAAARADLLGHSIAHASYLLNLASPDDALRARSIEGLRIEVDRCEALAIPLLVLHPGSHTGSGVETGLRRLATALDEVLKRMPEWDVDWENVRRAPTSTVRGWESLPVFTA